VLAEERSEEERARRARAYRRERNYRGFMPGGVTEGRGSSKTTLAKPTASSK